MHYTNISGYKFTKLTDIEQLQQKLQLLCEGLALKGTILLSTEGINMFLCASPKAILAFYTQLPNIGISGMDFKESPSESIPFKYLRIKIEPEIITMGIPGLEVAAQPAPVLCPSQFKQWLDEGKDMVVLDTRNHYEVAMGTFQSAIHLNIEDFRSFPEAIEQLPAAYKNKTVVTFCTGGIRCEKAAPYLIQQGFKDVYQLQGGILKYFETCKDAHFTGDCFVFDKRIAINAKLQESLKG